MAADAGDVGAALAPVCKAAPAPHIMTRSKQPDWPERHTFRWYSWVYDAALWVGERGYSSGQSRTRRRSSFDLRRAMRLKGPKDRRSQCPTE
jgi:hypothetical protein